MKVIAHKLKLPIEEIPADSFDAKCREKKKHGELLPSTIRAIFAGPSSCGKTNALLNLIYSPNGLSFENVYLYSKSLNQPKYVELRKVLSMVPGIGFFPFSNNEEVIQPEDAKPNSLFIFDDVACEKQNNMRSYFCMGRHKSVDSFYLVQTYSRVPKQLIRDNANFLVLFRQDDTNLRHIYRDHVNTDMTFEEFCQMCRLCWNSSKYGCMVIDRTREINGGRYRRGFDEYIIK